MSKVLGMHAVELKPGVDEREFEDFICNQVIPIYRRVPGRPQVSHAYIMGVRPAVMLRRGQPFTGCYAYLPQAWVPWKTHAGQIRRSLVFSE